MIINSINLDALRVGFKTSFQGAFKAVPSLRDRVATTIPSSSRENIYGWLGELSSMQKWLGPRTIDSLKNSDYRIENVAWQKAVGVSSNDIEDDSLGQYAARFEMLGRAAARHPEQLVFAALAAGFASPCYDGQNFFDANHPVIGADGATTLVANTDGGSGTPWFLLAADEVIKPIIFQSRKPPTFVSLDRETDGNVFMNRQFIYGVDARYAVGYGFWQMAWGSKQTLDATSYATARAAIYGAKGDHGVPMGLTPNLLVVPPSLESAARRLLNSEYGTGGATNEWKGTAEPLVVPWLA